MRRLVLRQQPICASPLCNRRSAIVDHIVGWAERGDMTVAQWDARPNLQGLCVPCHAVKTAAESARARRRSG